MAHVSANTADEKVSMAKLKSLFGAEKQDRGPSAKGAKVDPQKTPALKNVNKMHTAGGGTGAPDAKGGKTSFKDTRG